MKVNPEIDYRHVLGELSVNRKDACEIIRELISNSYDANAKNIKYWPILQYKGIAFFDDGDGLSQEKTANDISPYTAFFSIGKSTKTFGLGVGYKCQGSKLCFACTRFLIITKCSNEAMWRVKNIENPKAKLNIDLDVTPEKTETPWVDVKEFIVNPDERTTLILKALDEEFFKKEFHSGTLIITLEIEVEDYSFSYNPNPDDKSICFSYIYNYIRFATKHGDVRIIPENSGFCSKTISTFKKLSGVNRNVNLYIWCEDDYISVESGYPYLEIESSTEIKSPLPLSPLSVSRLSDGRFHARHAKTFKYDTRQYSIIFAIDGNRRALEGYSSLDRRGKKISGIRLTDQRGVFIASQGVKVCSYNELFNLLHMRSEYGALIDPYAQSHYILIIEGPFQLATNRNSPSTETMKTINNPEFAKNIKSFLDNFKETSVVFKEFLQRIKHDRAASRRDIQVAAITDTKNSFKEREYFKLSNIETLKDYRFFSPQKAEENWVGVLYTFLAHFVPQNSPYAKYWYRPLTFSGRGIDSIGQKYGEKSIDESKLCAIEYKYSFNHEDDYNHPLSITDVIIAWNISLIESNSDEDVIQIEDDYDCYGTAQVIDSVPTELAYTIEDITDKSGTDEYHKSVLVICLKKLIQLTFDVKYTIPPKSRKK